MRMIFYCLLFLAIMIYGIFHYKYFVIQYKNLGYVEGKGIVVRQTNYRQPALENSGGRTIASYDRTVKIQHEGREVEITYDELGTPDESSIGTEIDILISTKDFSKSISGSFSRQKTVGFITIILGAAGALLFGILAWRKFSS